MPPGERLQNAESLLREHTLPIWLYSLRGNLPPKLRDSYRRDGGLCGRGRFSRLLRGRTGRRRRRFAGLFSLPLGIEFGLFRLSFRLRLLLCLFLQARGLGFGQPTSAWEMARTPSSLS